MTLRIGSARRSLSPIGAGDRFAVLRVLKINSAQVREVILHENSLGFLALWMKFRSERRIFRGSEPILRAKSVDLSGIYLKCTKKTRKYRESFTVFTREILQRYLQNEEMYGIITPLDV